MYDALRINSALHGAAIANNAISVEAAVWSDAFQPLPVGVNLSYTFTQVGIARVISLSATQLEQVSWYGFFNNPSDPVTRSLSGYIYNSYLPTDYALNLMRINDSIYRSQDEVNPSRLLQAPALYRSELNLNGLSTLVTPNDNVGLVDVWKAMDPPVGGTTNPLAKLNFNAASGGNWTATGPIGGAHADFKDLNYPDIWTWWSQFLTANSVMAINDEK
jgi:hypothetical protein